MKRFWLLPLACLLVVALQAEKRFKDDFGNEFVVLEKSDVLKIFDGAIVDLEQVELIALDPDQIAQDESGIDGAKIVGRASDVSASERDRLLTSLRRSIDEAPEEAHECYVPRHAIHGKNGTSKIEIVLCFECLQGTLRIDGDPTQLIITRSAESAFDEVFGAHGLKKARDEKPNQISEVSKQAEK